MPDGWVGQGWRAEVLGTLADLPTRGLAMTALGERLRSSIVTGLPGGILFPTNRETEGIVFRFVHDRTQCSNSECLSFGVHSTSPLARRDAAPSTSQPGALLLCPTRRARKLPGRDRSLPWAGHMLIDQDRVPVGIDQHQVRGTC